MTGGIQSQSLSQKRKRPNSTFNNTLCLLDKTSVLAFLTVPLLGLPGIGDTGWKEGWLDVCS